MAKNDRITRITTQDNFVTEKIDVIQNNLLGDYDDEGNYYIAPQIVKELLELHKVKKSSFANSVFCVGSLLGYGDLVFELLFHSKTHNGKSASATLYLLEDVDKINGYLQNTLKTKLEDFNESVENFIEETYKHFNIDNSDNDNDEDDDDAEVLERKLSDDLDSEDSFIIAKKQYSLMLEKLLEEKFLDAYGKYFTARISTLTKLDNEFSHAVLDSFNSQYALIQNVFLKEKNYKILNELLDKCFEEKSGTSQQFVMQEKEYSKIIQPSLNTFINNVNKLNDRFENKALNMLDKDDRKKVEEIHEEYEDKEEEKEDEQESGRKPSVEQIVNNIPRNTYTLKTETKRSQQSNSLDRKQPDVKENSNENETHYIQEIMKKGSEHKQEQRQSETQNFYNAFKETHSASYNPRGKVVDTTKSVHIDTPENDEQIAVSSLQDRISRLEKFKNQSAILENDNATSSRKEERQRDDTVGSLFDTLSKEKARKDEQIDIRNKRNRAEIDSITHNNADYEDAQMSQREREELMRRYYDSYDMEK